MFESLVVGGFIFWLVTIGLVIMLIALIENEKHVAALISMGVYVLGMEFLFHAGWASWLISHPFWLVGGIVGYFVGGTLIVFPKWRWFLNKKHDELEEKFRSFIESQKTSYSFSSYDEEMKEAINKRDSSYKPLNAKFREHLERNSYVEKIKWPVKVEDHKSRILSWMCFWPLVLIWSLFDDIIKNIFRMIYDKVAAKLQSMADRTFSKFNV